MHLPFNRVLTVSVCGYHFVKGQTMTALKRLVWLLMNFLHLDYFFKELILILALLDLRRENLI